MTPPGKPPVPPGWLQALLHLAAGHRADEVVGDLHEWMARWAEESGPWWARLRGRAAGLGLLPGLVTHRLLRGDLAVRGWSLDGRLALRLLWKTPGLTLTSVVALAVTMGIATAAFTMASSALLGHLPVEGGERVVMLELRDRESRRELVPTLAEYRAWEGASSFDAAGAFLSDRLNLALPAGPTHQVRAGRVTPSVFRFNPVTPVAGRLFDEADLAAGRPVVLLNESLWNDRFGRDAGLVGGTLEVNGVDHTVVGILPRAYRFPTDHLALVPLAVPAAPAPDDALPGMRLAGRLRPGISRETAAAESQARMAGATPLPERSVEVEAVPFVRGFASPGAEAMFGALVLALVLLVVVAAANVANLVLARTAARRSELALRSALGASRARIVGQLFVEALALTVAAALLALLASGSALSWLRSVVTELPYWVDFTPGPRVLLFSAFLAGAAAVTAGVLPALRSTGRGMVAGMRSAGGAGFGRVSQVVIVGELALSLGLLAGAFALGQGLGGYARPAVDLPGDEVLVATLALQWEGEEAQGETLGQLTDRLHAGVRTGLEGIVAPSDVAFTLTLPGREGDALPVEVEGVEPVRTVREAAVDHAFFQVLGVEPVAGRAFVPADRDPGAPRVVLVNEPFVRDVLGGRNALGRRLRFAAPGAEPSQWRTIVGVVPDLGLDPTRPEAGAGVYTPFPGTNYAEILIRAPGEPFAVLSRLRRAAMEVDPRIHVQDPRLLRDAARDERALLQGATGALLFLGAMALLVSAAGLYAVLSFGVSRRTREIGVRKALGADAVGIVRPVVAHVGRHLLAGVVLGVGLGWLLLRGTDILPITVAVRPALHLGVPAGLLLAVGLAAVWRPLRRALAVQPSEALRADG